MTRRFTAGAAAVIGVVALAGGVLGQGSRLASPAGTAATEIRGKYVGGGDGASYQGGKWIEITYGRPIKRGRDLLGPGGNFGRDLNAGAPVWRAGANVSTRLKTELPLVINGKTVPVGEYSLFIILKPNNWTLIVSSWAAQRNEDPGNTQALWGSFGYTPAKDVVRSPMTLEMLPHSVDQLTWTFLDMTDTGGLLAIEWDKTLATVPFKVGG
jgi:hypothetical protein